MIEPFIRETVIRVTGIFDAESASHLRRALASSWAAEPGTVLVDFSLAREVTDVGIAALLEPLLGGAVRLRFRGLTHRQRQMMRLLTPTGPVGGGATRLDGPPRP